MRYRLATLLFFGLGMTGGWLPAAANAASDAADRYRQCTALLGSDPASALAFATRQASGAQPLLLHCQALAEAKLGRMHEAAGDFDRLIAASGSMKGRLPLTLLSQSAEAWGKAGDASKQKARLGELIRRADPADPAQLILAYRARLTRGALLDTEGETMAALQEYDAAIALGLPPGEAYAARSRLFARLKQPVLAAADARAALALSPETGQQP